MAFALDPAEMETRAIHDLVDFTGKDVLEVGCGDGRLTWRYAATAASVLAFDPVVDRIDRARANIPGDLRDHVTFRAGDITTLELPEFAFDVALLAWSIC